jgi:Bifunctional DNA primase/polymerase, N-terminal
MFDTKTPRTLDIIEDARLKTRLAELGRRQQETAEGLKNQHLTKEQNEAERFQYESNAYAAENARYSAARAASTSFLVVPLDGTTPLVDPREATHDPKHLLAWWQEWPSANPGIALGRVGGALALRVEDTDAYVRLRELTKVRHPEVEDGRDSVPGYVEYRELPRYEVRLVNPSNPVSMRSVIGWGRNYTRAVNEMLKEDEQRQPETFWLVWSYPPVTGFDAFEYRSRKAGQGLTLLGEGEVLAWQGSILDDGIQVVAPMSRPPEVPLWLAKTIGRPRSRKAMAAAREGYEAALRVNEAHVIGQAEARRASEDAARRIALGDQEGARKALEEAERA